MRISDFGLPFESLRALSMVEGRIERQKATERGRRSVATATRLWRAGMPF